MSLNVTPPTEDMKWQSQALLAAAIASLFCGPIIGWPVAIMSGVMAVTALRRRRFGTLLALAVAALAGVSSYITERLVLMAIHPPQRSKQSECRVVLKSLWVAERSFYEDHERYSEHPAEIGFVVEPGNRYAYSLSERLRFVAPSFPSVDDGGTAIRASKSPGDDDALLRRAVAFPLTGGVRVGVTGACPDCSFTAVCVANLDGDDVLDVWSVSSVDRSSRDGHVVRRGQPHCESNDLD